MQEKWAKLIKRLRSYRRAHIGLDLVRTDMRLKALQTNKNKIKVRRFETYTFGKRGRQQRGMKRRLRKGLRKVQKWSQFLKSGNH